MFTDGDLIPGTYCGPICSSFLENECDFGDSKQLVGAARCPCPGTSIVRT